MINDVLGILSAAGSLILLLGSFGKAPIRKYGQIADWSILGLVFGWGARFQWQLQERRRK
jgi:hypothetical protein